MKLEFFAEVNEDGTLIGLNRKHFASELKIFFKGKKVRLLVDEKKRSRSLQQHRYYWLLVTILANELGYDKESMHEIVKFKFLKREKVVEQTGEVIHYIESTTKLTKEDFSELTNNLHQWSAETFGIVLPLPGEQLQIDMQ